MRNPYVNSTVTFPEPWDAILRPGVRLCLGDPVEVVTSTSHYCVPVFTLSVDTELTKTVKSYASYFHSIRGHDAPSITVSYLTIPRFVLALRTDAAFRALVFTSPISVVEG